MEVRWKGIITNLSYRQKIIRDRALGKEQRGLRAMGRERKDREGSREGGKGSGAAVGYLNLPFGTARRALAAEGS